MTTQGFYHCSVKGVGRGNGASIVAKAAYRSGERLFDETTQEWKDYTRRSHSVRETFLDQPGGVQPLTRQELWNEAERADPRSNARLATELELALPHELNDAQRRELLSDFVHKLVEKHGVAADVAIHLAHDDRNIHAHVLLSHRELGPDGFGEIANTRSVTRKRSGEQVQEKVAGIAATPADIRTIRQAWERDVNRAYERA
jgi:ATP-dependent exoDNAse (exonuclease V) alpha subunit